MLAALQRKLMYFPLVSHQLQVHQNPLLSEICPGATDVTLHAADGVNISGWHFRIAPSSDTTARPPLLMFFHGNAGNRLGRLGWYRLFRDFGMDTLAIDYRGYGDSSGHPTEVGLHRDAAATWEYATGELGYRPDRICVMGVSLGGAVAVQLAARLCPAGQSPAALMLVATFSSMWEAAAVHYPWLPVRRLLIDTYDSQNHIGHVTCPVLMFHGDQDEVIPHDLGRKLFAAAPNKSASGIDKQFVSMCGVGHRGLAEAGEHYYRQTLPAFLQQIFP